MDSGERLENELGLDFLAFSLNSDVERVRDRLHGGPALSGGSEAALQQVLGAAEQLASAGVPPPETPPVSLSSLAMLLLQFDPDQGMTTANVLRRKAGGDVAPTDNADGDAEGSLAVLSRDAYPATLLPPAIPDLPVLSPLEYVAPLMHRHPARERFEAAVMDDEELMKLFSEHSDQDGWSGAYFTNLGYGGGIQLAMLADGLITAAHKELRWSGPVTADRLIRRTLENLGRFRELVAGKEVEVTARLGVAGLHPGEGTVTRLPWGDLRAPTEQETEMVTRLIGTQTDAVLETTVPMQLFRGQGAPPAGEEGDSELAQVSQRLQKQLNDRFRRISLTLFFALERDRPVSPVRSWTIFDDVVHAISSISSSPTPWGITTEVLHEAEQETVAEWAGRVDSHYHHAIDVAAQRVLSAQAQRPDPADGLVDAVIALENLFGTPEPEGEVTFRVSLACAFLLESDPGERRERRQEVAALYRERSKIVHGRRPGEHVWKDRDRAVAIVREALQILFRDRPELLKNTSRGTEIIVGEPDYRSPETA